MEKLPLPPDFKDFLQLLHLEQVEYLLVGEGIAKKVATALQKFGFSAAGVSAEMFSKPDQIIRMGVPPICIDVITGASGVDFRACYARRIRQVIDGVDVTIIHPDDLKQNKRPAADRKT